METLRIYLASHICFPLFRVHSSLVTAKLTGSSAHETDCGRRSQP
jgi:hypothetical protein